MAPRRRAAAARLPAPLFEPDEYYTVNEAACRLRVHRSTVGRYIASGKVSAQRVGARRLIIAGADLLPMVKPVGQKALREAGHL